jgi:hypothetical protein
MRTSRLTAAALSFLLVPSCLAGRPEAQPAPSGRIERVGFSVLAPRDGGWMLLAGSPYRLDLVRSGTDEDESYAVTVLLMELPEAVSKEHFLAILRKRLQHEGSDAKRFRNHRAEAALRDGPGEYCVLAHSRVEDHAAVKASFRPGHMILEAVSLFCRHPDHGKVGVNFTYTHRYYPGGADPGLAGKAEQFFQGAAFADLGDIFGDERGDGVPSDYDEAAGWYRKAAEGGLLAAQVDLGWLYQQGKGVRRDYAEAMRWYRKAAEQGSAVARLNIAVLYDEGKGVPEDDAEAARWYRTAAEQGQPRAQLNLGILYWKGEGVERDYVEAVKWLAVAEATAGEEVVRERAAEA